MVSHAELKTWPEGLSRQKLRLKTEVFVFTEALGRHALSLILSVKNKEKK